MGFSVDCSCWFELSTSGAFVEQFYVALHKAEKIAEQVFEGCDPIWACVALTGSRRFISCREKYRDLRNAQVDGIRSAEYWVEKVPANPCVPVEDPWEEHRYFVLFPLRRTQLRLVLWGALAQDLGIRPRVIGEHYLVNEAEGLVAHPYDDRGLDVVGPNSNRLGQLYRQFGDHLLEYDRSEMDRVHSASTRR